MNNKEKFSLKEALEVIAKHMQSLVKDELKKAESDNSGPFEVGQKVKHKPTTTKGWGKIPEMMAKRKGEVVEHQGKDEHGHKYKIKWTDESGKVDHDEHVYHHQIDAEGSAKEPK
jgi:hypothetical protein